MRPIGRTDLGDRCQSDHGFPQSQWDVLRRLVRQESAVRTHQCRGSEQCRGRHARQGGNQGDSCGGGFDCRRGERRLQGRRSVDVKSATCFSLFAPGYQKFTHTFFVHSAGGVGGFAQAKDPGGQEPIPKANFEVRGQKVIVPRRGKQNKKTRDFSRVFS